MSRRKQAKPRAFLKLGENPGDCPDETSAKPDEFLDPKEELLSDVDSQGGDDEEDEEDGGVGDELQQHAEQPTNASKHKQQRPHMVEASAKIQKPMETNGGAAAPVDIMTVKNSGVPAAAAMEVVQLNAKLPDNVMDELKDFEELLPKPECVVGNNNVNDELQDDFSDDDGVDDDIDEEEEDDEEDIHSLDSYYSDMYSTHTSSSYSPSISDGTITPNSLHHQHHLPPHLPPHHQLQLQSLQHLHDAEDVAGAQTQRLRKSQLAKTTNGTEAAAGGDDACATDDNEDEVGKNVGDAGAAATESSRTTTKTPNDIGASEQLKRQQQGRHHHHHHHHHRHAEHTMKIPTKLRKIDREAAVKFDKLTGDGIKSSADGSYQCQFCDKSFPRLGYLKKHEQSHAEHLPFKCDYCARLFKHKRSRDRHTKLHTGDRRYRCPHCEAAFSRSDHLKIHMKTHDNQKPFQCTICNRGYNTAAALTSHMQNHKKQAAILAAGGNPQALNYSPRSTGSASSNGSLHKRRYAMALANSDSNSSRLEHHTKRIRSSYLNCSFCNKNDFNTLEQLNAHIQATHEKELVAASPQPQQPPPPHIGGAAAADNAFQLACEYCTMKFPNIPAMFQHMRTTHIDRLTSPNSYFEHFNRLAASGTFSPRLITNSKSLQRSAGMEEKCIKVEQTNASPKSLNDVNVRQQHEEEPTDLSQNKRRSASPSPTLQHNAQHSVPLEKPGVFFCNQCNAGLPDFESFRNHLKSHIAQGLNLVCHHCGLSLREQSEYERHVIAHYLITNSEYNCTGNCQKTYAKPEELQKHLQEQHVITMYKCALCTELFDSKVAIQVHFACAHTAETKLLRCSACMEAFRTESDFNQHVKTRHATVANGGEQHASGTTGSTSLQCMFCRTVCASDLEMHFHLAAHARQFRCPSCPETFHVEFLLDRHMQSHHGNEHASPPNNNKETFEDHTPPAAPNHPMSPMNSLYVNALFGKTPLMPLTAAAQNNNNSIIDYNVAFAAAHLNKGLFPNTPNIGSAAAGKFYSPLQVDTGAIKPHPALMYGLSQRYFDTNRSLMDMYAQHQQDKQAVAAAAASGYHFISPKHPATPQSQQEPVSRRTPTETAATPISGFSCDMCERNDFRTEAEVHSHRKIVHNMKTGVSLRCAYCSGNFKSRSELEHHMKTCHNSTGKHKCLICDEIFPSPAILAEHKLQHSKVGQSGKCSHCAKPLGDVNAFKSHLAEHNNEAQMPVQCICCRQSLHSDFEIGLHAKFHTKSSSMPESVCALCLEPIQNMPNEAKVCEKCCRKHNLNSSKYNKHPQRETYDQRANELRGTTGHYVENRCNLCKMILPHAHKLQEHLVEHTFAGCEDRGFICYICSAVFTAPSGLLNHMTEHGLNARPYDCNLCTEKYYFRAELDHHLVDHELRDLRVERRSEELGHATKPDVIAEQKTSSSSSSGSGSGSLPALVPKDELPLATVVKQEILEADQRSNMGEDDEYIEVEKEVADVMSECKQHEESNKTEL